jgi:cysteine synthase A
VRSVGLETQVVDPLVHGRAVQHLGERGIALPTFSQLADPDKIPERVRGALARIGPDEAHPLNLFRVHWFNDQPRTGGAKVPEHVVLPPELTGVEARVVVALGDRFPMIGAHKVLAAYGCLAPLVVTGRFDPTSHRAVWPSTGNYCRGGVAISRIMGCRGVAVLPEGMSRERFDWLADWVVDPVEDIIRTPGTESNVKEIYDECARLAADPRNVILNQFSEFGNYLAHFLLTGTALGHVYESLHEADPSLRLRAFVSASGSAGTLGAGDYLKEHYGSLITAVEALECPTMLYNGFGEHNVQGIGDKHIPLIHNVMNTDVATAVSDQATDQLHLLFNSAEGRSYLARRRGVPEVVVDTLPSLGLSSICNVLAAIKTARYYDLGPEDVIVTVATDGSRMYRSELEIAERKYFPDGFDGVAAGEVFGQHVLGASTEHLQELSRRDRERVFNLGYYTWVEQQGVSVEDFEARRPQRFWRELRGFIPVWDQMIEDFNGRSGAADAL